MGILDDTPRDTRIVYYTEGKFPISDKKVQVVEMLLGGGRVQMAHWSMAAHDYHGYNINFLPGQPTKLLIHQEDKEKYLDACAAYIVSLFVAGVDGISLEGLPVEKFRTDLMDYFCQRLSFYAEKEDVDLDIDEFKRIARDQQWEYLQSTSFLCRKKLYQASTLVKDDGVKGSGRVYELVISGVSVFLILAEVDSFSLIRFLEQIKPRMDSADTNTLLMGTFGADFFPQDSDEKTKKLYALLKEFTGLCNPADRADTGEKPDSSFYMTLSSFPAKFLTATGARNYATLRIQEPGNRRFEFFQTQDPNPQATAILDRPGTSSNPS